MRRVNGFSTVAVGVAIALLAACSSDTTSTTTPSTVADTSGTAVTTTSEVTSTVRLPTTTAVPTTVTAPPTTAVAVAQMAIWPAADIVFATPEAAATDFITKAFGVSPSFGPFVQSDARSGEIEVMIGEAGAPPTSRSTLVLRQLGPADGWFVLAAVNDAMTIDAPVALAAVPASALTVSGTGRGFEALIVAEAFIAGSGEKLDSQMAMGGSAETSEPFTVTLDLSAAQRGDTAVILIRGGVGLENDTGEFSALAVTVAG